jgi:2-isopropylmalate synthase
MRIRTFDTTLRDGSQGEAVNFSVTDKLSIAHKLAEFGIDYIEGGWPISNPKDKEFFELAKSHKFGASRLCAFGSTRFARNPVEQDPNVLALLAAETPAISIFGKSWDLHVKRVLGLTEEENLTIIADTVRFLKAHGREVIYDAEHWFDGYIHNPDAALRTLDAAKSAGADVLVLCDTNGGTLPARVSEIVSVVRERFGGEIGIHAHNDCDLAVANSLAAVESGATHVQGTMNGYGERCGNANLASLIAILEAKLGYTTVGAERLTALTGTARYIAQTANLPLPTNQPFVGRSAFAHKGGVHVSAVMKEPASYEHINPELVGNRQRVLLSDMSGRGNIVYKLEQHGFADRLDDQARRALLERIKQLEYEGYEFESAEGSFELLVHQALRPECHFFDVINYEVGTRKIGALDSVTRALVILSVKGEIHTEEATGSGPVHALDLCLRNWLASIYPAIARVDLIDYKVRVLDAKPGSASKVRVLVKWDDGERTWATIGVSENILEASWHALTDAIQLELMRQADAGDSLERAIESGEPAD